MLTLETNQTSTADLAHEIAKLKLQLASAEEVAKVGRLTSADRAADMIRQQLQDREREFALAAELEARAADERRHVQQLEALQEIEADEARAKGEIIALQRELQLLPGRLQFAQQHHNAILQAIASLKMELGL
jgi:hypothetical protein